MELSRRRPTAVPGPSRPAATPEDDSGPTGPFSSECLEGCWLGGGVRLYGSSLFASVSVTVVWVWRFVRLVGCLGQLELELELELEPDGEGRSGFPEQVSGRERGGAAPGFYEAVPPCVLAALGDFSAFSHFRTPECPPFGVRQTDGDKEGGGRRQKRGVEEDRGVAGTGRGCDSAEAPGERRRGLGRRQAHTG